MQHPFNALKGEYENLLSSMQITRVGAVEAAAHAVLEYIDRYIAVQKVTHVPAPLIGGLNLRESDQDFHTGLGQGDRWDHVSVHVPAGKGPFKGWEDAAIFYIHYDHLDDNSAPWSMAYACWKGEIWNGFGPRNHGIHSGYLWAGSNHYSHGKYIADGVWSASHVDTQLGIIPVIARMIEIKPELAIGGMPDLPAIADAPPITPQPAPVPFSLTGTKWLQDALNRLGDPNLTVDGNYGRRTRNAVRAFQTEHGLTADGLAGDVTCAAIDKALGNQ